MNVVVLHNAVANDASAEERDVLTQRDAVTAALTSSGHQISTLACTLNLEDIRQRLMATHPDVVFNLVESLGGTDRLMILIPELLEASGISFTGAGSVAMAATASKLITKQHLRQAGLPTAPWMTLNCDPSTIQVASHRWILKPVWEHASVGMDDDSVVIAASSSDLRQRLLQLESATGRACFAEEFIEGREFNLSILAGTVLPPAEIDFSAWPDDKPRIVGHRAKWDEESFEYQQTPRRFDFPDSDGPLLQELCRLAQHCHQVFQLSGYARVDFRVDAAGRPWILEINVNPCLSPDAGFAAAVEQSGQSFEEAIRLILQDAVSPADDTAADLMSAVDEATSPHRRFAAESSSQAPTNHTMIFRNDVRPEDAEAVRDIVTATEFFRPDETAIAVELVEERLNRGVASGYEFLFAEADGKVVGYTCYGPIACTLGSYDLFWIAVHPAWQGRSLGKKLLNLTEQAIISAGGRHIYIETSGKPQYAPTRGFYERCGYTEVSVLTDFYDRDDDKVVWRKIIGGK
ncbi:MAG: GNAT family N-acetyltransferase [Planctomycetaceae bacterium]|nr:GNAT family N-acetyltransferase [Planctomycetaceae bacterium]